MKKKLDLIVLSSFASIIMLSGCNKLHVHDYSGPYFHDENEHWQVCSKCQEKINLEAHTFNELNDTCLTCAYVDPVCIKSAENHMTGLTKHGKTKYQVSVPQDVTFIDDYAFKDSSVGTVNLSKGLVGIYENAFKDSHVTVINTEEALVRWVYYKGIYYKDDILTNYEAMIDGKTYVKLEDAFNDVSKDNTTITLLKDNYNVGKPVDINNTITLESYQPHSNLVADFNIGANGWLKIPNTITYKGTTKLQLVETIERCLESEYKVYSSGSLVFAKTSDKPEDVEVNYVDSFDESKAKFNKKVKGHKQIVNEAVVIENDYYVYGTYILSLDYTKILGLTPFGKTISGLTITNPFDEENNTAEIGGNAFITMGRMDIDIGIKTIVIRGQLQKGAFHNVIIDKNITRIGNAAFSTRVTHDASAEFRKLIALITSPLYTIEIGENVKEIGDKAFEDCESLEKVTGGKGLERIGGLAFGSCANLKSVDFSEAINLVHIQDQAFGDCTDLKSVKLPTDGWTINGCGYLPTDMTPEIIAFFLIKQHRGDKWERKLGGKVCAYNPSEKDGDGRCNKVKYYPSLQEAINASKDGYHIYLTNKADAEIDGLTVSHRLTLECDSNTSINIKGNVTINPHCYLLVTSENVSMEQAKVTINGTSPNDKEFYHVGGLGLRKASNSSNSVLPDVEYAGSGKAKVSEAKIGDDCYFAYGLFKFKVYDESGYNKRENIHSRTEFCVEFTDVTVDLQLEDEPDDRYVWLGGESFKGSTNGFKNITLGDKVVYINDKAFYEHKILEKVTLGSGLVKIGANAFYNCHKLTEIDFTKSNKLEEIGNQCFGGCTSLKEITLYKGGPTPLKRIGSRAFENTALEKFDLGENYQNWKHNGTACDENRTKDPTLFAQDLRTNFMTHEFKRETTSE